MSSDIDSHCVSNRLASLKTRAHMLTSLRVQNFRSCVDTSLFDIGPSLLLVGPNNAGKTTIMKAVCWASDVATVGGMVYVGAFHSQAAVELHFKLGDERYRYRVSAATQNPDSPLDAPYYDEILTAISEQHERDLFVRHGEHLTSQFDDNEQIYSINRTASTLAFLKSISPESSSKLFAIDSFLRGIRYYALDSVTDDEGNWSFVTDGELDIWRAGGKVKSSAATCLIQLVDLWRNKKDTFDELKTLLGPAHLDIVRNIEIEEYSESRSSKIKSDATPQKRYLIAFEVETGYVVYHELSFGTKRIFQALIAIFCEPSSVMLLEQPEDGIHPGLLARLVNVLLSYADPMQLILTSHSSTVLNIMGAQNIRIVQLSNGETHVHALSTDELTRADQYVDLTGQLADYIRLLEE